MDTNKSVQQEFYDALQSGALSYDAFLRAVRRYQELMPEVPFRQASIAVSDILDTRQQFLL